MQPKQKLPKQQKKHLSLGSNKVKQTRENEVFITVKIRVYKIYNYDNSLMCQPVHKLSQNQEAETSFLSSKVCTGNWAQGCCHIHCTQVQKIHSRQNSGPTTTTPNPRRIATCQLCNYQYGKKVWKKTLLANPGTFSLSNHGWLLRVQVLWLQQ